MFIRAVLFCSLLSIAKASHLEADLYAEYKNEQFQLYSVSDKLQEIPWIKNLNTPLGSLWKLFVYSYIKENHFRYPPYKCKGQYLEEAFCCQKGDSIGIDQALIQSCGLYFWPFRLNISKRKWRQFWVKAGIKQSWFLNYDQMNPRTIVPVKDLLLVLKTLRNLPVARKSLDKNLLKVVLEGTAKTAFAQFGQMARIKTFTWNNPNSNSSEKLVGGFAGLLTNGTLIWGRGVGKGHEFVERVSHPLSNHWATFHHPTESVCVRVGHFYDYPIKSIRPLGKNKELAPGPLVGKYEILFESTKTLLINSNSDLIFKMVKGRPRILGVMKLSHYLARVLDREIESRFPAASEAFSIVARTYFHQRAKKTGKCFTVIDSSKFQRVSPNIPSEQSLRAVYKTAHLVLNNVGQIQYHESLSGKNRISWLQAKALSLAGKDFTEILSFFFPKSKIVLSGHRYFTPCKKFVRAQSWLNFNREKWNRFLVANPGFENPGPVKVCHLDQGAPFSDHETNEIFIRDFKGLEAQYSLAHEFIHLAFKNHPLTQNESQIDRLAKNLIHPNRGRR